MAIDDAPATETAHPPAPIDVRNLTFTLLAIAAGIGLLRYAWEILLPAMMAVLISYAFDPVVSRLGRLRIPRAIAAALVLTVVTGVASYGIYGLGDDALAIVEDLPASARKLRESWNDLRGHKGAVQTLTQAVAEIEKTAAPSPEAVKPSPGVTRVQVEQKPFDLMRYIWWGSLGMVGLMGQAVMVLFLAYFLLASGDLVRRKLVKLTGPTLGRKRVTVQILDQVTAQIERFLIVQMITCALVGVVSALAFRALGLERAVFWGLLAGVFNTIPYFGPLIVMAGVSAVAYVQFGTLDKTLAIATASIVITGLEGNLLLPYWLGKQLRMNGVAVFLGLMFWGWVWGVWGLLLAMPMMVILKTVCDHVPDLQGVGELLGE